MKNLPHKNSAFLSSPQVMTARQKNYFSNFKRQSFILGQNIPILTAKKQLSWLLNANTKEQITKAFEIEPINKEFYNEIKKAFDKITTQIPTSKIITESKDEQKKDFALKLIGRVLFIRFLKELNLVPNEVFEVQSLQGENYYKNTLAPLFLKC
ncbi:Uncharacterised protein [Helicobacter fennelliae]|uniref:Uncharacterized protein n=1 Tax=Helicobacter fennelliae TaxID=215 RepID=A0A2X3DMS9_9HELI|nr:hypothetical protein [Helicobacter fennelliae]SQB99490.1 Uncharacterised protein [Helicobacter fennelliae]STQ85028.1 Uncharacterised protein [Helicobacter fennelliae]